MKARNTVFQCMLLNLSSTIFHTFGKGDSTSETISFPVCTSRPLLTHKIVIPHITIRNLKFFSHPCVGKTLNRAGYSGH